MNAWNPPKLKYIITDSKDDFMTSIKRIADRHFNETKDNLRYLEQLDKIRQVREGVDIFEVFPWLKKDNDKC